MEEEMANNKGIDGKAISGMKIGLMGPIAGVGDPILHSARKRIAKGRQCFLLKQGRLLAQLRQDESFPKKLDRLRPLLVPSNRFSFRLSLAGPLLFFFLLNAIRLSTKYYGLKYGYVKGMEILQDLAGNRIQKCYLARFVPFEHLLFRFHP